MDIGGVGEVQSFQAAFNLPDKEVVPPEAQRQEGGSEDRDNSPNRVNEADRARRAQRLERREGPVTSEERVLRREEALRNSEPDPRRGEGGFDLDEDSGRLDVTA